MDIPWTSVRTLFQAKTYKENLDILSRQIMHNMTVVRVYFKELGIVKYSRDELYGIADAIGIEECFDF